MKATAVLLLVVSVALHPCVGHAAWQPDGTGVAIVAGAQARPTVIPDGTGGTIITWWDSRSGGDDIYAQRLNGLGVAQWTPNGVVLCSAQGTQNRQQIVPDGSGGAIVAWIDFRNGNQDVFAQRVNGSGLVQWTADGVALCTAAGDQSMDAIPSSFRRAGGAIVAWTDERNGIANRDIYARRVNGAGWCRTRTGWRSAPPPAVRKPVIVSDGMGGAIITWMDNRTTTDRCRSGRVGRAAVTANGVARHGRNHQFSPEIVPDGGNSDRGLGRLSNWSPDIYAQRLNASGVAQWTLNGVILC
jgi:hypothetical protein